LIWLTTWATTGQPEENFGEIRGDLATYRDRWSFHFHGLHHVARPRPGDGSRKYFAGQSRAELGSKLNSIISEGFSIRTGDPETPLEETMN